MESTRLRPGVGWRQLAIWVSVRDCNVLGSEIFSIILFLTSVAVDPPSLLGSCFGGSWWCVVSTKT